MKLPNPFLLVLIFFLFSHAAMADDQPIKIGWIGPLTGNAAVLGVDTVPAVELAFESANAAGGINGKRLRLIVEDDQYTTAKTVSAYNRLVHQEGVKAIIVLTYGGIFSISPNAQKDGVLLIDPLDCDERIAALPENTLCITKRTEDLGRINAEHAISNSAFPAGVLYFDGDPFMGIAIEATAKTFAEHGQKWAFAETYNDSTMDYRTVMLKAKQANLRSLFFYGYDQMGIAMKQARDIGIKANFYTLATSTSPGFQKLAGAALDGVYFPTWQAPRNGEFNQFANGFRTKVGRDPHMEISTVPSFDIAQLIVKALKTGALSSSGEIDVTALRKFFYQVKSYSGASGSITVDSDGITRSFPVTERVWKNGKAEIIP